jgi:hypothetical protein
MYHAAPHHGGLRLRRYASCKKPPNAFLKPLKDVCDAAARLNENGKRGVLFAVMCLSRALVQRTLQENRLLRPIRSRCSDTAET